MNGYQVLQILRELARKSEPEPMAQHCTLPRPALPKDDNHIRLLEDFAQCRIKCRSAGIRLGARTIRKSGWQTKVIMMRGGIARYSDCSGFLYPKNITHRRNRGKIVSGFAVSEKSQSVPSHF